MSFLELDDSLRGQKPDVRVADHDQVDEARALEKICEPIECRAGKPEMVLNRGRDPVSSVAIGSVLEQIVHQANGKALVVVLSEFQGTSTPSFVLL